MTAITDISQCPLFDDWFRELEIPGDGHGLAVGYESDDRKICVAIGRNENGGIAIKKSGMATYDKQRSRHLTLAEFLNWVTALDCQFKKNAVIGAEEILDGESYFVKWCDGKECHRLVLTNPRETHDKGLKVFVEKLDSLIRFV